MKLIVSIDYFVRLLEMYSKTKYVTIHTCKFRNQKQSSHAALTSVCILLSPSQTCMGLNIYAVTTSVQFPLHNL